MALQQTHFHLPGTAGKRTPARGSDSGPGAVPATDAVFEFDVAVVGMGYVGLPTSPEPQEQSQTEHELSTGTCRRCAEVQHGGPS